ncbi:MAG: T9SS type A sorting domain-containing protein [Saprospiraceae bacterium]|jgi:hypothetical protein|nr:T9SS type A sorting domain-containing protein [Saprospiraceae bacterium]
MRKNLLALLVALGAALSSHAQYTPPLIAVEQKPCPYNPGVTVVQPQFWHIYQTLDGHWYGPVDSSRCISVSVLPFNAGIEIALEQVNPAEPLFLRARLDLYPPFNDFSSDYLYNTYSNARILPGDSLLRLTTDCPDDLCSGAFVGIAIPDENGMPGAATRFHTALVTVFPPFFNSFKSVDAAACFPTERFAEQRLKEYILKFTFADTANMAGRRLLVYSTDIVPEPFGPGLINSVFADSNPYPIDAAANPWGFNFLGLYTAPTYPGPQNPSYIEVTPVPNPTVPQNITLTVEDYQTLEMQPFAQFRGGLVAGSATERHQVTLLNNGGDLCLNFVDLIFDNGDALYHAGGQISMNNAFSCMQFRNGSELRVKEGAALHYGQNGAGMLVICANSTIALERNATLVVDCILQISECNDALPPHDIFIDLPPGARLIFTENAWLTNRFSKDKKMRLNVRMLGGTLDDSALPPDSRAIIRRVYPERLTLLPDNMLLSPNPFAEFLTLYLVEETEAQVQLQWVDVLGRPVLTDQMNTVKGYNVLSLKVPAEPGAYFLTVSAPGGRATVKLLRGE